MNYFQIRIQRLHAVHSC